MLKVELLSYTPDADKLVAAAAKLCYAKSDIDTLLDGLTPEKTENFLDMLTTLGHQSPVEHASFTFGIEGVSRALLAQLTRHRIASFSVQSQRYVSKCNFEYITPPEIEAIPEAKAEFIAAMEEDARHYENLQNILKKAHLERLIAEGKDAKEAAKAAEKMANEDARFVLPNACDTRIIMTMNVRSLYNFFTLRCCNRAQWEIRELATQMLMLVREVAPFLFKNAGPACLRGKCSEASMTCGKMREVKEKFAPKK
ncbi:MAG: FAD-dependent thymidylate synthase [Clostridia bacterium]|nr:FAD-dependent thymidylate synthase [Clostridia bacterium]